MTENIVKKFYYPIKNGANNELLFTINDNHFFTTEDFIKQGEENLSLIEMYLSSIIDLGITIINQQETDINNNNHNNNKSETHSNDCFIKLCKVSSLLKTYYTGTDDKLRDSQIMNPYNNTINEETNLDMFYSKLYCHALNKCNEIFIKV